MEEKRKITLMEVGPRDGFQNICSFIPTEIKLKAIDLLVDAGLKKIMITSFVSPKAIPQMQDASEIAKACVEKYPDLELSALVPNMRGVQNAAAAGLRHLTMVISASKSHNLANVRRTPEESLADLASILEAFPQIDFTLDLATAFACPFEGETPLDRVRYMVSAARDLGIRRIDLCDTVGMAYPSQVRSYLGALMEEYPEIEFMVHIHDTRNMGMVNTLAAIECGINTVQATAGGLGGCPFAPGASGNTASEDLIYMLNKMGYDTGVDFDKLLEAARFIHEHVDGNYSGHHLNIKKT